VAERPLAGLGQGLGLAVPRILDRLGQVTELIIAEAREPAGRLAAELRRELLDPVSWQARESYSGVACVGFSSGDTWAMRSRLTSSHLVGRVRELAELELAVREAQAGRPALVLLGGDSGVGKTRLIGELEHRLAAAENGDRRAALVLRGEAVEQGESELPYAPLLGALRPLVRERNPALDSLSAGSCEQLETLLPGLGEGPRRDDRPGPTDQLRLFEAVLELLDVLSESEPVVLILEDMHWADRSTMTFVSFLARSLREERATLLLSYRTDELHRRHPLRPLLSELERLGRSRRIQLEPFDRNELTEALKDILGDTPSEPLVERLFGRSEGNPLYTEELLAAGLDGRGAPPQSLRDAFMLRIERLSADAQRAARAIAVGRRLDEAAIGSVTGIERDELNAALREAVSEQVLVPEPDGSLRFRHALLREALHDDLLPGERGELHLALARFFDGQVERGGEHELERASAIARHYAAAGDQPQALRATVRAAVAAQRVRAYGEVSDLAERALELWPRVPEELRDVPLDHVGLLALAARAYWLAGHRGRGEVMLESALQELDPDRDRARYASVLAQLARTQWSLNRGKEGVATAERALAMLGENGTEAERASLIGWLARTRLLRGQLKAAVRDGQTALQAALTAGDRHAESEVLNTLGMAEVVLGPLEDGVARLRRAIEITREIGDGDGLSTAYSNLADVLGLVGRTNDALVTARDGLAATPSRLLRSHVWSMLTVAEHSFNAGDWAAARAHLVPEPSRLEGLQLMFRELCEAELALGEGDEETAAGCLDAVEPLVAVSAEPQWIGIHGCLLGELRARRRDLDGARAAVEQALDRIELCTDDVMRISRVSAVGARVEADRAQRARDLRESAELKGALARVRIHLQRLAAAVQDGGPVERAYLAVGKAESARARARNDPALWRRAAESWEAIERPYPAAITRWREAEAHVEAGKRAAAAECALEALETARRLGASWLVEEVSALCERARLTPGRLADRSREAMAQAADDPFGLTPRERQVLTLLAQGATNRQIGAALYMAEKTASVHVSRILSKLDVQSRTQAAAVAHRLHLEHA
jgi:DNA-binding NarL/FixJ family response regulator